MSRSTSRAAPRAPGVGLAVGLVLPVLGLLIPLATGWQVASRAPRSAVDHAVPPLHGFLEVTWFGPGTVPAVALALLGWRYAVDLAERLAWRRLLVVAYAVGLGWLLALALVTGTRGIGGILTNSSEYLPTVRQVGHSPADIHRLLQTYIARIPIDSPGNWPTQVAGHPPGMVLVFVGLSAIGLGGAFVTGLAVTVGAASIPVAVLVTLRALGAEPQVRRAAPFLVLTPAAVFLAVSGDAVIATVVAWGLACLALGATAVTGRGRLAGSAGAGLLLGYSVMMSYGMPLVGLVALAVLVAAGWRWQPLPVAVVVALAVVLAFAVLGFAWWQAYPVLNTRYHEGVARFRPYGYWVWADFGALAVSAGPLLFAGLACAGVSGTAWGRAWWAGRAERTGPDDATSAAPTEVGSRLGTVGRLRAGTRAAVADRPGTAARASVQTASGAAETVTGRGPVDGGRRVVLLLVGATAVVVLLADLSGMSKAEVERIWLPFIPWLTLSCALLPDSWRRPGVAVQVVTALLVEHLLHTAW